MYIDKVISFSKQDKEADVYVTDGNYRVRCYVYPTEHVRVNQNVNKLLGYNCTKIIKREKKDESIEKNREYYAYTINGKVVSKEDNLVQIGNIQIYLDDHIPDDIEINEYVSFSVTRIDVY